MNRVNLKTLGKLKYCILMSSLSERRRQVIRINYELLTIWSVIGVVYDIYRNLQGD